MSHPGSAAPSVEERIAEIETRFIYRGITNLRNADVDFLLAEHRARDEALREARKDSARLDWLGERTHIEAMRDGWVRSFARHGARPIRAAIDDAMSTSLARTEGGDVE